VEQTSNISKQLQNVNSSMIDQGVPELYYMYIVNSILGVRKGDPVCITISVGNIV
jgi:hypothetical protein